MNFLRIIPLFVLSLLFGVVITGFYVFSLPPVLDGAWAVLAFDENEDDRLIGEMLSGEGFRNFLSESNQVVYISDFNGFKNTPLDKYGDVLEPYDPRNDGFAAKLRHFFVREGKRYFLVPFEAEGFSNAAGIRKLENAFVEIPYDLELYGQKKTWTFNILLGAAALAAAFALVRSKGRFFLQFPILSALAWTGPGGLILAGLLTGICMLLPEILAEIFPKRLGVRYAPLRERLEPYRMHLFLILFFLLFYGLFCFFGAVPFSSRVALSFNAGSGGLIAVMGLLFFFLLEFLSLLSERKSARRVRFSAVWMMPGTPKAPVFRQPLIPFALAALTLLIVPFFFPNLSAVQTEVPVIVEDYVTAEDYENHLAFQLSFSYMPFGRSSGPYLDYQLSGDGLIAAIPGIPPVAGVPGIDGVFPPFPLEKFSGFLVEYDEGIKAASFFPMEWISVLLLFAVCVTNFYRQGQRYGGKKKTVFYLDRQVAA